MGCFNENYLLIIATYPAWAANDRSFQPAKVQLLTLQGFVPKHLTGAFAVTQSKSYVTPQSLSGPTQVNVTGIRAVHVPLTGIFMTTS